jgi:hypothetical protein
MAQLWLFWVAPIAGAVLGALAYRGVLCRAGARRRGADRHRRHRAERTRSRPEGGGAMLTTGQEAQRHRVITDAVHAEGGKIALQILHFGRYAYQPALVAPSPLQAPIAPFTPHEL